MKKLSLLLNNFVPFLLIELKEDTVTFKLKARMEAYTWRLNEVV